MRHSELKEQVQIEFENLHLVATEIKGILAVTAGRDPSNVERTAAGAYLAQFYGGIENIMKRFVKNLGGRMPSGDAWHVAMAQMFVDGSENGMPVLFSREQFTILSEYRKCRHAVRNCYGHELVWDKLHPLMERLPEVIKWFEDSVAKAVDNIAREYSSD